MPPYPRKNLLPSFVLYYFVSFYLWVGDKKSTVITRHGRNKGRRGWCISGDFSIRPQKNERRLRYNPCGRKMSLSWAAWNMCTGLSPSMGHVSFSGGYSFSDSFPQRLAGRPSRVLTKFRRNNYFRCQSWLASALENSNTKPCRKCLHFATLSCSMTNMDLLRPVLLSYRIGFIRIGQEQTQRMVAPTRQTVNKRQFFIEQGLDPYSPNSLCAPF